MKQCDNVTMKQSPFNFEIIKKDKKSKARVGKITTSHGVINTPCFVPVGTKGSVKSLTPQDLEEIGVQILFGNTYHLHLAPGEEIIQKSGGLSKFIGWSRPTITDSGGFQVFSLGREGKRKVSFGENTGVSDLVKIKEDGVVFRSYIDGSVREFTPEKSIQIQQKIGADIILAFDQFPGYPTTHEEAKKSIERTHEWALRSLKAFKIKSEIRNSKSETISNIQNSNNKNVSDFKNLNLEFVSSSCLPPGKVDIRALNFFQAIYGIVQGGTYEDLRRESAEFISNQNFDGIAIGGVAVGEGKEEMRKVLKWTIPYLPDEKPKHLLGVGEVDDIFHLVEAGMDTFDCVIPTRLARTGFIFVSPPEGKLVNKFRIDLEKSKYAKEIIPLDNNCSCCVCKNFSRAYVHHLFKSRELLAYRLASYHNLYFIIHLTSVIREAILEDKFEELKKQWMS